MLPSWALCLHASLLLHTGSVAHMSFHIQNSRDHVPYYVSWEGTHHVHEGIVYTYKTVAQLSM